MGDYARENLMKWSKKGFMNLRIAICDDEKVEIEYISSLIEKWKTAAGHTVVLSCFESAESFLFAYGDEKNIDILLLDIQMSGMDGVKLARKIRTENESVQIVFITGFPDYIAEGYEVSALHYLMKPVKEDKLREVLDRAVNKLGKEKKAILFNIDGESVRIYEDDILWLEAFSHTVKIHTKTVEYEVRLTMSEADEQFSESFFRCHRSYLVNLATVKGVTKTELILDDDTAIPLSRRLYQEANQAFISYFKGGDR